MTIEAYLITGIITLVSIILTAIITRYYSQRKKLQVVLLSAVDIVDLSRISDKKISVLYNSEPIENLWVLRLIFRNTGNQDISGDNVKSNPKLVFDDNTNLIDIESSHIDDKSSINCNFNEDQNSELNFDIEYLKRGEKGAFQVLAHTENNQKIKPQNVELDKGIIQDAEISLINFKNSLYPIFIGKFVKILKKKPILFKIFAGSYIVLGVFFIAVGVGDFWDIPFINSTILESSESSSNSSAYEWIFPIIIGLLLCLPSISVLKRLRYRDLFPKRK